MPRRPNYAPSQRLTSVRDLIHSSGGLSVYEIANRLGVNVMTARRYVRALEDLGVPIYDELGDDGKTKIWRIQPGDRRRSIEMSVVQMIALYLGRAMFEFLDGTGFKEDLDDVFTRLSVTLKSKRFAAVRNLERKLVALHEARFLYDDQIDDVNDILTALLKEEQLQVVYRQGNTRAFIIDPYTLLVHRGGLYLVGHSHKHGALRTFAVDELRRVEWLKGASFRYPDGYDPNEHFRGSFGVFTGPAERVRIRLHDPEVIRRARRRQWHPSQRIRNAAGGAILTLMVYPGRALENWILGFGETVEVVEPAHLREAIRHRLSAAAARY